MREFTSRDLNHRVQSDRSGRTIDRYQLPVCDDFRSLFGLNYTGYSILTANQRRVLEVVSAIENQTPDQREYRQ